jgi:hypothetical protein
VLRQSLHEWPGYLRGERRAGWHHELVGRKWADQTGDRTHPLTQVDVEHHGFEEIDADGNPDLALAPPAAA